MEYVEIAVSLDDKEASKEISKLLEKNKAIFYYYGDNKRHYKVLKSSIKKTKI